MDKKEKLAHIEQSFPLFVKVAHYFTKEKGEEWGVDDGKEKESMSRQENKHHFPRLPNGLLFLFDYNCSFDDLKRYCYGIPTSYQEFLTRLRYRSETNNYPTVLIACFDSLHKRAWYIKNNRILIYVNEKEYQKNGLKYESWKNADYLLLYKWNDPEVARLFRLDKNLKPEGLTSVDKLNAEENRCPGLTHRYYLDFHWVADEYYDIWHLNWMQVFDQPRFQLRVPNLAYICELFGENPPHRITSRQNQDIPELPYQQTAADEGINEE